MFVSDSLLDILGVEGDEVNLQVNTIVGTNTIRTKKASGLCVQDIHMGNIHQLKSHNSHIRHYQPNVEIGMLIERRSDSLSITNTRILKAHLH